MKTLGEFQADIMMILSGVCGIMALFICMSNTMSRKRKHIMLLLEISAMFLLIADRRAYIHSGDISTLGWWMTRISNFLVFFLTLVVLYAFNLYLIDLYTHEGGLAEIPKRLLFVKFLALAGMAMVIVSQFTGFYYTFDEMNRYHRAPGFIVCYVIPLSIMALQMSVILQYYKNLSSRLRTSLFLFTALSVIAAVLQVFMYGVSLNNMMIVGMAAMLFISAIRDLEQEVEKARIREIEHYKEEKKNEHALFEQTAEALATAIDAKDKYTHGHSARVAMYSTQIARDAGKSEEECERVYFAALLHDVGKIGIPDHIINKDGKLTDEEFAQIKHHPEYGNQILSNIRQSPYLSIAAHYHHERFDGRGYPRGLVGEDIPEIARIIAVADSYDAMTSKRSYRDTIPQQKVREELVKGIGTQFDPQFAKIMLHLIDQDLEYSMRERETGLNDSFINRIHCERLYHDCSTGIPVNDKMVRIRLFSRPDDGFREEESLPVLVLFDALDARIHEDTFKKKDLLYFEYARIRADGQTVCEEARKIESSVLPRNSGAEEEEEKGRYTGYEIAAVRIKDHMLVRFSDRNRTVQTIIALPDSSRFVYISLSGEHCMISNISVNRDESSVGEGYIPRIVEEISYIKDCPQGDIPNMQIDGWRSCSSQGLPLKENLTLSFHTRSLPTARLVWHCPFVSVFTSKDGRVDGEEYQEFMLLRLDGENWESDTHAENTFQIDHTRAFPGWNDWKKRNKEGMDCVVTIRRDGNRIKMETENLGISISSQTVIKDDVNDVYVALTGDQCCLTDIHIRTDGKESECNH